MADSPYIFTATADNFYTLVLEGSHRAPVLVDFWAEWCAPCRMLMPLLAKMADRYRGKFLLAKVNTEEEQELATQYGIRSLPTVKLFQNGQPVDEFMGALPESEIRAFLDRHVPRASDTLLQQANALIQKGDVRGAADLVRRASDSDPDNPRAVLAYAQIQATLGDFDAAEQALADLPPDQLDKPETAALRARIHFDRIAEKSPPTAELEHRLASDPGDSEARYRLAARKVMEEDYENALEALLQLLLKDRQYGDDAGRRGMLQVFDILGSEDARVKRYRGRMFNALH